MAEAAIPVDLFNPGQVFACLGFLEAAEILLGDAEGGFNWSDEGNVKFRLRAQGDENPVAAVLEFLAEARLVVVCPRDEGGPWPSDAEESDTFPAPITALAKSDGKGRTDCALPVRLERGSQSVPISHWLKGDGRQPYKLFAGQQVGWQLTKNMLFGDSKKKGSVGYKDVFATIKAGAFADPFAVVCPVGGRFGFDSRGGWDAMRIGTSLDEQGVLLKVAPHVELLAAIGLENARPCSLSTYQVRYAIWRAMMPVALCRAALSEAEAFLPRDEYRLFTAHLGEDKQYKKFFFAELEN